MGMLPILLNFEPRNVPDANEGDRVNLEICAYP